MNGYIFLGMDFVFAYCLFALRGYLLVAENAG